MLVSTNNVYITRSFTLIEMLLTVSLIAILSGVAIANLSRLRSNEDLIRETVILISQTCAKTATKSLVNNDNSNTGYVCSIVTGTGSRGDNCDLTSNNWQNINNNDFSKKIVVTAQNATGSSIKKIRFFKGNIYSVKYINESDDTIITNTILSGPNSEVSISPINIRITTTAGTICKIIQLWPNGVTSLIETCR